jgi:hypothetical protein
VTKKKQGLREQGHAVLEVNRPDRRYGTGKARATRSMARAPPAWC